MGRARRRRKAPFRAWGTALAASAALLGYLHDWRWMAVVTVLLVIYLLIIRLTRCRVETLRHQPCRWLVRGLLGTCDYHVGYKRGLPRLVRSQDFAGLPTFMWPRDWTAGTGRYSQTRREPQPTATGDPVAERAKRPAYDVAMLALAIVGVLIAGVSLLHDVFS